MDSVKVVIMEDRVSRIHNWDKIYISPVRSVHGKACKWCEENLGKQWQAVPYEERDGVWCCFWRGYEEGYEFSFKYNQDAMLFALKWA